MHEKRGGNSYSKDDTHCRREKPPAANERLSRRSAVVDAAVVCSTGTYGHALINNLAIYLLFF